MKCYTGIGSRKTPEVILELMERVAYALSQEGYILRSGAAPGADTAFEKGAIKAGGKMEIFLPWSGFESRISEGYIDASSLPSYSRAAEIAKVYHPAFDRLSFGAKKLQTRNTFQVLGADLNMPSQFLICWTADGCISARERTLKTGGTGQAIILAGAYGVPVFNLAKDEHLQRFLAYVD